MVTMLGRTYEMASSPPALAWEAYEKIVCESWQMLLSSNESNDERNLQAFFEQHPCMIPGPFGLIGTSGHTPYPEAMITQPVLPEFTRRIPDFMWIARDSETVYPVLIEIESPKKRWFRNDGTQHSDLTQALNQLSEWKEWFKNPLNQEKFYEYYDVDKRLGGLRPLYILIYGRRSEANKTRKLKNKRSTLARSDEFLMTFDRLQPQYGAKNFFCVRITNPDPT